MYRTLGEWGRREAHKNKTDQTPQYKKTKQTTSKKMRESRKKVELGRVGRKGRGHWVNGVGEEKKKTKHHNARKTTT